MSQSSASRDCVPHILNYRDAKIDFSLAITRQLPATVIGIFLAWPLARTDLLMGRFELNHS